MTHSSPPEKSLSELWSPNDILFSATYEVWSERTTFPVDAVVCTHLSSGLLVQTVEPAIQQPPLDFKSLCTKTQLMTMKQKMQPFVLSHAKPWNCHWLFGLQLPSCILWILSQESIHHIIFLVTWINVSSFSSLSTLFMSLCPSFTSLSTWFSFHASPSFASCFS